MKQSLSMRIPTSPWKRERLGNATVRRSGLRRVGESGTVVEAKPSTPAKRVTDTDITAARHNHRAALAVLGQPQYDQTGRVVGYDDPDRNRTGMAPRLNAKVSGPCRKCGCMAPKRVIRSPKYQEGFWCSDHGPDSTVIVTAADW